MLRATLGQLQGIAHRVTDLVAVVSVAAVTVAVVALNGPALLRVPAALLSVLVLPGYVCTAVLFPADGERAGVTRLERAVLTVGLSIALVALAGVALDALVGRLTTATFLLTVVTITGGLTLLAAVRRRQVAPSVRYEPTLSGSLTPTGGSRLRRAATVAVVMVALVFAAGAVATPQAMGGQSDGVTEFYLLSEDGDGERRASDYPTEFATGRGESLSVAIGNQRETSERYTVVGQLQRAQRGENGVTVRERTRLSAERVRVDSGETRTLDRTVTVDERGRYRLVYLLYRDDAPESPRIETAYRELHLWITVTEGEP